MRLLLLNAPAENTILADNPSFLDEDRGINPPLGLLYLASYLKKNSSHEVEVLDMPAEGLSYDSLGELVKQKSPQVIGITAMTFTMPDVIKAIKIVKTSLPEVGIVLGGPHPTLYPRETVSLEGVDFVIAGEGEEAFLELLNNIDRKEALLYLNGIFFKQGDRICGNGQSDFIEDLDRLPFPDRALTPYQKYNSVLSRRAPITTMFTSRGCPFGCNFCDRPQLGKRFRARSAGNVVDEMQLCYEMGIKEVLIYDDTFTIDRKRVLDICGEILERGLDISWDIRARVDTVDEEMIKNLKIAGCARIHYGVEAGTQKILDVLNKGFTLSDVESAFRLARKYGIQTLAYFMIGSPAETRKDILTTIAFAKKIKPDYLHLTITTPFPGTKLYKMALELGLYERDYWRDFARNPSAGVVTRYWEKELSRQDLLELLRFAYKDFYRRPSYLLSSFSKVRSAKEAAKKIKAGMSILLNSSYAGDRKSKPHLVFRYKLRAAAAVAAIKRFYRTGRAINILDFGSSDGLGIAEISKMLPNSNCTGIEYSRELLNRASKLPPNVRIIHGDATNLAPEINCSSFNVVTIIAALGYLSDPVAALKEARRVLCDGGIIVITSPVAFWNRVSFRLGFLGQDHRYTSKIKKQELMRMIEDSGMRAISFRRFMWLPLAALPYFKLIMPLWLVLGIEKSIGWIKIFDWLFVNQIIVAEKS